MKLKHTLKRMRKRSGEPFCFQDDKNYACLVGQRYDFYIFIEQFGSGYWSAWMKGKEAATFWDECVTLDGDMRLYPKLAAQYRKLGRFA
jgi:hypothetical protein